MHATEGDQAHDEVADVTAEELKEKLHHDAEEQPSDPVEEGVIERHGREG